MLRIATSRELDELLGPGVDATQAIEDGAATRTKIREKWLYTTSGTSIEEALDAALESTESYLEEWLLGRAPFLVGGVRKLAPASDIGRGALDLLLKELASQGRLGGLALSNARYQPFIAFHRRADADEISVQVEALSRQLARAGRAKGSDLPEPARYVPRNAWRDVILKHGEWRGWGWIEDGELIAWE